MNHEQSNEAVDITRQIERKIRALRCHVSQHRDPDVLEQRVRDWFRSNGHAAGLPEGSSAEQFYVVDAR